MTLILIADDNSRITSLLSRYFEQEGLATVIAHTGSEALQAFERERPDISIIDVRMPPPDGFEVLQTIHASDPEAEVILITGHADTEMAVEALRSGASDFITKPPEMAALDAALQRAQERLRLKRELKLAQTALREERDKAQMYLDLAGVIFVALDTDEKITLINHTGCSVLGRAYDDIVGQNWFDSFVPQSARQEYREVYHNLMHDHSDLYQYAELPIVSHDGTERLTAWHITVLRDETGQVVGTLASGIDITERKIAEEHLQVELDVNKSLAEISRALIASSDSLQNISKAVLESAKALTHSKHGQVSSIDPETGSIVGHINEMETEQGPRLERKPSPTTPLERGGSYPGLWSQALNTRQAFFTNSPGALLAHDGLPANHIPIRNFLAVPAIVGEELFGQITLANSVRDYSERDLETISRLSNLYALAVHRRRAEEALQRHIRELDLLYRSSQVFGSTLSIDHMLTSVLNEVRHLLNVAACSVWLLDRETGELVCHQATGPQKDMVRGWRLTPGEGVAGWVAQNNTSLIIENTATDERHYKEVDHQTGLVTRSILSVPLRARQEVIGVLQVVDEQEGRFNQSDLKLLESLTAAVATAIDNVRLADEASQLEILQELDRLRSELIANVSHELRTPLGLIKVFTTTLMREDVEFDSKTRREFLQLIDDETDKLEELVNNLLDLSRLESGRLRLERHPTDMGQLIRQTLESIELQLTDHNLSLDIPSAPLTATFDPKRIEQVLLNLVSNAAKYSPNGGTITVGGRGDAAQLLIWVQDEGIGIPPQDLERVFERFYRVDNELTRQVSGVGLGLSLCKGIVESHGGQIWVDSTQQVGSTFYFTLPRGIEHPEGEEV